MAIGATDVHEDRYLFNDPEIPDVINTDDILDEIMVSATYAALPKGVMPMILRRCGELI